jgi:integrase
MAALSHALTIAVNEWEWLESNPMKKVKKPKEPRGRVRYLSDDERERLFNACMESNNGFLYTVVLLATSTGMRLGEIMGLSWSDIDINKGRIVLQETKNGERRTVPLVGKALDAMKKHNQVRRLGSNYIFPSKNGKKPACIRVAWNNAIAKAEVENFHFHDLRHSTASYLAMNGASLAEIADILGHKTLQMVKRYAHLSDSHVAGVLEDMNKKVLG